MIINSENPEVKALEEDLNALQSNLTKQQTLLNGNIHLFIITYFPFKKVNEYEM